MLQIFNLIQVLYVVSILAASISSIIYLKNRELDPIRFYFLENIIGLVLYMFIPQKVYGRQMNYVQFNLFFFMDLAILYYYFWTLIATRLFRRIILGSFAGHCQYLHLLLDKPPLRHYHIYANFVWHPKPLIIVPCLLYIYELFKSEEEIDLKINPHFYIACAVLFFYGATFPILHDLQGIL